MPCSQKKSDWLSSDLENWQIQFAQKLSSLARWFVPKLANAYFGGYARYVLKSFSAVVQQGILLSSLSLACNSSIFFSAGCLF
jgi:hypothetical protein